MAAMVTAFERDGFLGRESRGGGTVGRSMSRGMRIERGEGSAIRF